MGALVIRDVTDSVKCDIMWQDCGKRTVGDKYRHSLISQGPTVISHLISEPLNVSYDAGQVSHFYSEV